MTDLTLATTIVGLGLADALNPFSIAAMALVLSLKRPLLLGVIFLGATYLVYLSAGIVIVSGWGEALKRLAPLVPKLVGSILISLLGLMHIGYAIWHWIASKPADANPKVSIKQTSAWGVAAFAILSTLSDLPTALPYVSALYLIENSGFSYSLAIVWIALYCFIYVSPLVTLLLVRQSGTAMIEQLFDKINKGVVWCTHNLIPPLAACFGLFLGWFAWAS
jgi:hypothetical protein